MAFAITQTCCTDASCVAACPVNCIHPTPGEADFATAEILYIDPRVCIDCGACADACPVDAIFPLESLSGPLAAYGEVNAEYYADRPTAAQRPDPAPIFHAWDPPSFDRVIPPDFPALDVAVVGSGPAGMYAVQDLLLHTSSRVTLIDRLPVPGGLVNFGVAPDHPSTKRISETFDRYRSHHRLRMRLGVEVGRDVTAEQLAASYDAVIYAVGAPTSRDLGVPGEDLPGSVGAITAVGWYNGHPDVADAALGLGGDRVVVVGNGNVALDVARILTTDPDDLAGTAISPAALARLRTSSVREVVLLGRRGPDVAAYTRPEMLALTRRDDVEVVVDDHDGLAGAIIDAGADKGGLLATAKREVLDHATPPPPGRRIVLRFSSMLEEITGTDAVDGVRVTGADGTATIPAGLVVRAIGHRGRPVPGLPFDEASGTVPHEGGRVVGASNAYVVGWIKRGPSGGIGANRADARDTVGTLLDDVVSGRLAPRRRSRDRGRVRGALRRLLARP
ncbi:FAD-dependent oxidoreductase [Pseudonocardia sp. KRD291]|uniref:FAD-dependent oxidoreductase n=1 Tax=Pseudonocardia sp. KRD291 TaxID=2792007 RepID=UPI001C49E1E7|nr:FAD-dependent oxidoreductase [Pseudonocardia sp. KRD291]MBW0103045.1 FAD-dependent oxidoreductase [Pseudonocardia sp. KRD291]